MKSLCQYEDKNKYHRGGIRNDGGKKNRQKQEKRQFWCWLLKLETTHNLKCLKSHRVQAWRNYTYPAYALLLVNEYHTGGGHIYKICFSPSPTTALQYLSPSESNGQFFVFNKLIFVSFSGYSCKDIRLTQTYQFIPVEYKFKARQNIMKTFTKIKTSKQNIVPKCIFPKV